MLASAVTPTKKMLLAKGGRCNVWLYYRIIYYDDTRGEKT